MGSEEVSSGIDLSLVGENELWFELRKRFDAILMVTVKNLDNKNEAIQTSYSGGKATCIGMAERAKHQILESMRIDDGGDE